MPIPSKPRKTKTQTPRPARTLLGRFHKPRTKSKARKGQEDTISQLPANDPVAEEGKAEEAKLSDYCLPVEPPTREEAMIRAMRLCDLKSDQLRAATSHVFNAVSIPDIESELRRLSDQANALAHVGLWCDATPEQEILALSALCEHYPRGAKIAEAGTLFKRIGQTFTLQVPSSQWPHKPYLVTYNSITRIALCNCPSKKECWHQRAARHLAALYLLGPCPVPQVALITIENLTVAALDAVNSSAMEVPIVPLNPHSARLHTILGTLREYALQGAAECPQTCVTLDDMVREARGLLGGAA